MSAWNISQLEKDRLILYHLSQWNQEQCEQFYREQEKLKTELFHVTVWFEDFLKDHVSRKSIK